MTAEPRGEELSTAVSPVDRLISELDGTYYKLSEVAVIVGVASNTIRRWMKKKKIKAPSFVMHKGDLTVYLFTAEDVEEIKDYYGEYQGIKRRVVDDE